MEAATLGRTPAAVAVRVKEARVIEWHNAGPELKHLEAAGLAD
jgi:hypothetical protein